MMRSIRPPESKQATTLLVAVRCRPLTSRELARSRDILRVVDDKVVVVLDPDVSKDYLDRTQNRTKGKQYAFDVAFGPESTNKDVYEKTVGCMVEGVIQGLNATVFAYGATGSGKTHTMAGTEDDPGLMVLSLQKIFSLISSASEDSKHDFEVTCSYLEVYNEVIYDLLEKSSGHLELREDPDQGITVAGLKRIQVSSTGKILELLNQGNNRRKTESTDANAASSRSHAVLEITVKRKQRNHYRSQVLHGKLSLVDLAGSERASETNNARQKLRDGANINKSLLALANCINALGKQHKKGLAYVPYRNSKLTRLLKDGLSGNSRTVMVATVSSAADQYHHTINTLKYADRAKEIKTHIQANVGTVDAHVADYQRMIDNLQVEVSQLRRELSDKETILNLRTPEKTPDDELSWLDSLSHDINENVEERINLQKALFELEDMNMRNRNELQKLDELIAEQQNWDGENEILNELVEHRQIVLDNIRDNDEAGTHYRQDIELNEAQRKELQQQIDNAISSNRNQMYLRILSQYRLLGMTNMELQFQMAIRDQIIQDQREALDNMWRLLESVGLSDKQILEIASQRGIDIEGRVMPSLLSARSHLSLNSMGRSRHMPMKACSSRLSGLIHIPLSLGSEAASESRFSKQCINGYDIPTCSDTTRFDRTLPDFGEKEAIAQEKQIANGAASQAIKTLSGEEPYAQDILNFRNTETALPVISTFSNQHSNENESMVGKSKSLAGGLWVSKTCTQPECFNQKELIPTKRIRWRPSAEHQIHELSDDSMDNRNEVHKTKCLCNTSEVQILKTNLKQTIGDDLSKDRLHLEFGLEDLQRGLDTNAQTRAYDVGRTNSVLMHQEPANTPLNCFTPLHGNNEAFVVHRSNPILRSCLTGHAICDHAIGHVHHLPSISTFTNLTSGSGGCDTANNHDVIIPQALLSPSKHF